MQTTIEKIKAQRQVAENALACAADVAERELLKMKSEGKPFEEIFDFWYQYAKKKDYHSIEHIEVDGIDIWDWYYGGYPDKYATYTIEEIVEFLTDALNEEIEDGNDELTEVKYNQYLQLLMDKNIGSVYYDW